MNLQKQNERNSSFSIFDDKYTQDQKDGDTDSKSSVESKNKHI